MRICHGVAGHAVEIDEAELQWKSAIDLVKQCAHDRWDMSATDLIALFSGGGTVGPGPIIDSLGSARDIFVFLRSALDARSEVSVESLALTEPTGSDKDDEATPEDELLRLRATCADPAFEVFRSNIEEAQRWIRESRPVNALAIQAVARLGVQRLAAEAVLENLTSYRATCSRSMELFMQKYSKVQHRFDQHLADVEPCMNALSEVVLNPGMQAPGREVLADLVPRERINKFTANLQAERKRLDRRLEKLKQQDTQVQRGCEQVQEHMLQFSQEDGVESVAEKIKSHHARAETELLPELRSLIPSEGAAPTSVLEEEKRSAGVLEVLAKLCGNVRAQRLPELQARWEQRQTQFLQRLREVSYVQSKVRDVERQAALLEEEINVQRGYSEQLSHLKKMPKAYEKMLHEVARRQQFHEHYLAEREQTRLRLARMAEEENNRRRTFLQRHGCHLPAELAHGLGSLVPPVTIHVAGFDAQLPKIDFNSVTDSTSNAAANSLTQQASPTAAAQGNSLPSRADTGISRDRTSSTSSCGSFSQGPQKLISRNRNQSPGNRGGQGATEEPSSSGQGDSSGQAASSVQAASVLANSQDGGTATGGSSQSLGGTGIGGAASSASGLEAQNRELSAQVESLKEELAQLRQAQAVDVSQVAVASVVDADDSPEPESVATSLPETQ